MNAKVKCSNCGAEITNLNFSWGKKQWLWAIPFLFFMLIPMWQLYRPSGNAQDDLRVSVLETRMTDGNYEILGTVTNAGKHAWDSIELDAEFFTPDGKFSDEANGRIANSIASGKSEYFKIVIKNAKDTITNDTLRMEVNIADAYSKRF